MWQPVPDSEVTGPWGQHHGMCRGGGTSPYPGRDREFWETLKTKTDTSKIITPVGLTSPAATNEVTKN